MEDETETSVPHSLHVGVKFVRHVGVPEVAVSWWLVVNKMELVCTVSWSGLMDWCNKSDI